MNQKTSVFEKDQGVAELLNPKEDIAIDAFIGLSASPKFLLSKYFYDSNGSRIFQAIMQMPEYYLTNCEKEIFASNINKIGEALTYGKNRFDLIELGSGDGSKTKIILESLVSMKANFKFIPIDISQAANNELALTLAKEFPDLPVEPETGDYMRIVERINSDPYTRKVILFLGSNIGNLNDIETTKFLKDLYRFTRQGDKIMIGFDLKKSPSVIMDAYNDPHGLTRKFNLNHLLRLNRELQSDFDIDSFEFHVEYNPISGMVKSYLLSTVNQFVTIKSLGRIIEFKKWEPVFMELSRKFDPDCIETLASEYGFRVDKTFKDRCGYFADSLWIRM